MFQVLALAIIVPVSCHRRLYGDYPKPRANIFLGLIALEIKGL